MNQLTAEQLRQLGEEIVKNPDKAYDLTPEEQIAVEQHLNPLGNVVAEKKVWANISVINLREKYMMRLLTTTIIGYNYRLADEYVPEDELAVEDAAFKKKFSFAEKNGEGPEKLANMRKEHEARRKLITTTARKLIKKFLDRNYEFNPDHHLRGSHSETKEDPDRKKSKDQAIRDSCANESRKTTIDAKLESKPDATYKYMRERILSTYTSVVEAMAAIKSALGTLLDPEASVADKQGILLKKYKALYDMAEDMKKIVEPLASAETLHAWKVDPPADVFHHLHRYYTNHFEQLKEVVQALYNEKPDIEFSIIFYNAFKNADAARVHRQQHEKDFRAEVYTIENSGVTLLGPYKENRGRVDFYNKNTEVLKRMQEQIEKDHALGKDLMEKKVKKEKAKNIKEAGPDDPGLKEYQSAMNTIQELGAKKVLNREEMEKLEKAKSIKEDNDVPEDAIQVDLFFPKENEDGETVLDRRVFYTQAEAPLHMQENSEFAGKYQPKRQEGESLDNTLRTKKIVSRDGQVREIKTINKPWDESGGADKGKDEAN